MTHYRDEVPEPISLTMDQAMDIIEVWRLVEGELTDGHLEMILRRSPGRPENLSLRDGFADALESLWRQTSSLLDIQADLEEQLIGG